MPTSDPFPGKVEANQETAHVVPSGELNPKPESQVNQPGTAMKPADASDPFPGKIEPTQEEIPGDPSQPFPGTTEPQQEDAGEAKENPAPDGKTVPTEQHNFEVKVDPTSALGGREMAAVAPANARATPESKPAVDNSPRMG